MRKHLRKNHIFLFALSAAVLLASCSLTASDSASGEKTGLAETGNMTESDPASEDLVSNAVNFDHELDDYKPKKDHYNFYFTYKTVHSWWDAVALGMEDAQRQYLEKGITITYEYIAPEAASAEDQKRRLREVRERDFDVIGVDVADGAIISPILDEMVDLGFKVMTFSSSDAVEGCKRIAYVGNTHNYEDGQKLTQALCKNSIIRVR